ncbi:hypothetical protein ILYODFUR_033954, partial [Ilyodon furcidens]
EQKRLKRSQEFFICLNHSCALPQASSIENKQDWIKHIREVIQERTVLLRGALKEPIHIPKATTAKHKGRRDGEDLDSQGDASSQPDTISIASRTSQNTLDSDK